MTWAGRRPATARGVAETLLISAVVFGPLAFGASERWSLTILQLLLFLLLIAGHLVPAPAGSAASKTLLPAVLGVLLLALFQAHSPGWLSAPASMGPFTVDRDGTLRAAVLWAGYACLLWSAARIVAGRGAVRLAWVIFILGIVIAVVGLFQLGAGNTAYYGLRPVRRGIPFGPYPNYNHAASFMSMAFLLGMGLTLSRFWEDRSENIFDFLAKQSLLALGLALLLLGIAMTHSRGGIASLLAASLITAFLAAGFIQNVRLRWALRMGLTLAAALSAALLWQHPHWLGFPPGQVDTSTTLRLSMYKSGYHLFRDFPLFGTGLGALTEAFAPYQESFIEAVVVHCHSDWLELLLQSGLVGLSMYATGVLWFCLSVSSAWGKLSAIPNRCLAAGAFAAVIAFLLHGFLENSFQIPANAVIFFAVATLTGALPEEGPAVAARPAAPRRGGLILVSGLAAAASWAAVGLAREQAAPAPSLVSAYAAYRRHPSDPRALSLMANILWRLERRGDAAVFTHRWALTSFSLGPQSKRD